MGHSYGQLSLTERIEIYRLHAGGKSLRSIGLEIGRAPSSICRELKRNARSARAWPKGGYAPERAHNLAKRRRVRDKRFKLARQPDLRDLVRERLAMGLSPEQIAGRLAHEHGHTIISHESIYRYVYHRSANKDPWHRLLPRRKASRGHRPRPRTSLRDTIKHRIPITRRPDEAANRAIAGHWEADHMLFATPGQAVLAIHERTTRYTIAVRPPNRRAATTTQQIRHMLETVPSQLRKSLTLDNGGEFALHYQIGIDTFFCDTHAPWQKGGIENAIGRLRRFLPRKTNLDTLQPHDFERIIHKYNNTPRKCLDFQTPAEAFSKLTSTVALQT